MNRLHFLVYVHDLDAQNSKKKWKKKKKNMQLTTIRNTCNITKHFVKLKSET